MKPKRIQLSRKKGWRMPPNTVKVDRTTKWGNPFAVSEVYNSDHALFRYLRTPLESPTMLRGLRNIRIGRERSIELFSWWILEQPSLMLALPEIRGKNLACWCKPGQACHADALLELANEEMVK